MYVSLDSPVLFLLLSKSRVLFTPPVSIRRVYWSTDLQLPTINHRRDLRSKRCSSDTEWERWNSWLLDTHLGTNKQLEGTVPGRRCRRHLRTRRTHRHMEGRRLSSREHGRFRPSTDRLVGWERILSWESRVTFTLLSGYLFDRHRLLVLHDKSNPFEVLECWPMKKKKKI